MVRQARFHSSGDGSSLITMASRNASLKFPLLLAIAAPLAVIVSIAYLNSVLWTFAIYQVFFCLVAPAVESRLNGRGWREHAVLVGLRRRKTDDGSASSRRVILAIALGLITMLVTGGFLVITRDRFLNPGRLESTLAGWGVSSEQVLIVLAIIVRTRLARVESAVVPDDRLTLRTFVEVFLDAELQCLVDRDVKGLYKRALAGELPNFSGISDPYEAPTHPEIVVRTDREAPDVSAQRILDALVVLGVVVSDTDQTSSV